MTTIVFGSVVGAPGASTLALGVTAAWPESDRQRVLVEVDPDGGRLGAELGIGHEPGLMAVAVASRARRLTAADLVTEGAAQLGGYMVIPAPPSPEHCASALSQSGVALARTMADEPEWVWVIDAGRISPRSPAIPLAKQADQVVLASAGSLAALQVLPTRIDALVASGCRVGVVIVGSSDWPLDEIAAFCGCDVLARVPTVRQRRRGMRSMNANEWRPWWAATAQLARVLVGCYRRSDETAAVATEDG